MDDHQLESLQSRMMLRRVLRIALVEVAVCLALAVGFAGFLALNADALICSYDAL